MLGRIESRRGHGGTTVCPALCNPMLLASSSPISTKCPGRAAACNSVPLAGLPPARWTRAPALGASFDASV
eukprot:10934112-Lingulodinium_polyedra.AAC.1